jgi:hypothetical protein
MVLSKRVGKPPRDIARALVKALSRGAPSSAAADVAGPGFVNLRVHPSAVHSELEQILACRSGVRPCPGSDGRAHRHRVRERKSYRTAAHRARARRHLRRLGRALARGDRQPCRARVLHQRLRQPGPPLCRQRLRSQPGPTHSRGWLRRAATSKSSRAGSTRSTRQRSRAIATRSARECVTWTLRGIPGSHTLRGIKQTCATSTCLRRLVQRRVAPPLGTRLGRAPPARGERAPRTEKDGALFFVEKAADDRAAESDARTWVEDKERVVRKIRRRLHLLRERYRVPLRQALARLRSSSHLPRRRPPRLCGANPQRARGARTAGRAIRSAPLPARVRLPRRQAREVLQARGHIVIAAEEILEEIDDAVGADGGRTRRAPVLLSVAHRQHERRVRPRPRQEAVSRQPRLLRPVRARASLRRS